ncbi:MAG: ABC transporter ATP-binding protein [bacterium]
MKSMNKNNTENMDTEKKENNEKILELNNITKYYKIYATPRQRLKEALNPFKKKYHQLFYALKNINIELKKGEILGIVGRNGSGKSTLLKIISKVLTPSSGSMQVRGHIVPLLELGSGFNPEFTGRENIYFYASILGFNKKWIENKVNDIISFADIGIHIDLPIKTYSSGMRARLAFAVAINVDPEILILDEVLAVGDELFKRKCYVKMEALIKDEHRTILFVSHSAQSINRLCTRAVLLDKGELILEGSPKLITTHYQKFLYAKDENKEKIRNEIIKLNKNEEKKAEFGHKPEKKKQGKTIERKQKQVITQGKTNVKNTHNINKEKEQKPLKPEMQEPYFVPNFKPKSTVEYRNYDVDIYDVKITTLDGKEVNQLIMGDRYIYTYKVKFNIDVDIVNFGMSFHTDKGQTVTGISSKAFNDELITNINTEKIYKINYEFDCYINRNTYYTNAGVIGKLNSNDKLVYLNRIVDAYAFKVVNLNNIHSCAGIVYLNQEFKLYQE